MKWVDPKSRRKWPRKHTEFAVSVKDVSGSVDPKAAISQKYIAREISAAGMGLDTPVKFAVGDLLRLQFTLPGEQRTMSIDAVVINLRNNPKAQVARPSFYVGLKFMNLNQVDQNYLMNYMSGSFLLY